MEVSDTDRAILITCASRLREPEIPAPGHRPAVRGTRPADIDLDDEPCASASGAVQGLRRGPGAGQRRRSSWHASTRAASRAVGSGEVPARRWQSACARAPARSVPRGWGRRRRGGGARRRRCSSCPSRRWTPARRRGGRRGHREHRSGAGRHRRWHGALLHRRDVANGQHKTAVRDFNQTYGATVRAELSVLGQSAVRSTSNSAACSAIGRVRATSSTPTSRGRRTSLARGGCTSCRRTSRRTRLSTSHRCSKPRRSRSGSGACPSRPTPVCSSTARTSSTTRPAAGRTCTGMPLPGGESSCATRAGPTRA